MASLQPQRSSRSKRSILELAGMIECTTGIPALMYASYGCYCGIGGQGWPRDGIDWCCHKHDCCYGRAERAGCYMKTDRYRWTCYEEEAYCDTRNDKCETILCRCDRELARCLRNRPYTLNYAMMPGFFCGWFHLTCN
ncbi:hypothetical protein QQF64_025163 [Cirrhinus molitorella]